MIPRYTRSEMGEIWSDRSKLQIWMEVELCSLEAMAELQLVPSDAARDLRAAAWRITEQDVQEVAAIEEQTKHDVIAFLTYLERRLGPDARYLHMGMTSSDVLDTTLAIQLDRACTLLLSGLDALKEALFAQIKKHRHTVMVGRTHGIHAEPVTFGLVMAIWHQELDRHRQRLIAARSSVAVGKISGAVGTFAHLPLEVEQKTMKSLGLDLEPISNQVVQRDRHAELFCALANLGASIEKIVVNIRHLQRTEVNEVAESFSKGQRGSSAMPHKKNPIGCENLTGVARLLRSYAMAALENVALWHERDISHSSVERVIAPDATILTDYALDRLARIVENLWVDPERMKTNLELSGGLVYSQAVLLALINAGMQRENAYEVVQQCALKSWDAKIPFKELLLKESKVTDLLGSSGLERCFEPDSLLSRSVNIFERVFGNLED